MEKLSLEVFGFSRCEKDEDQSWNKGNHDGKGFVDHAFNPEFEILFYEGTGSKSLDFADHTIC